MNGLALDRIVELAGSHAGLGITGGMRERLSRCLRDAARRAGVTDDEYAVRVVKDRRCLAELVEDVAVHESSFFRDVAQFDALANHVLPSLTAPIRIWSSGCARGQEPYSLAMLLQEAGHANASVIATDLSARALEYARCGGYPENRLRGLSDIRRSLWMTPDRTQWVVNPAVRNRVTFSQHNIATESPPFPPGHCQVIFCRNVLIYFRQDALIAAIDRMLAWLPVGGLLFLGFSESLWKVTDIFDLVKIGETFIYRKPGAAVPVGSSATKAPPERGLAALPVERALTALPVERALAVLPADREHTFGGNPQPLPGVGALLREGELAMAGGDPYAAAAAFRQAAYLDGEHPIAHFQLGHALDAQGQSVPAARAYRAARSALRRINPDEAPGELLGYRVEALVRLIDARLEGDRR